MAKKRPVTKTHNSLPLKAAGLVAAGILVILVILQLGSVTHFFKKSPGTQPVSNPGSSASAPRSTIDYSPAKPSESAAADQNKGTAPAQSTPPASGSSQSSMSITITGANAEHASQSIEVSALAQGTTTGTCTFKFSDSNGGPVRQSYSESVQASTNYYACPRHSVRMPSPGQWYVSATLNSGSRSASANWAANPVAL